MARAFAPVRRQRFAPLDDSRPVWLYGLHAVRAALANDQRRPRQLLMTAELARAWSQESAMTPRIVERGEIDALLPAGAVHQGIALLTDPLPALALEDFIASSPERTLTLVLDQVTDPHNVGAILRSAAAFGAGAVIVQERHCAPLSGTAAKAACGALERVPVIVVTNLARGLRCLQQGGFWCIGLTDAADRPLERALGPGRNALVLGAEGDGLRRLTGQTCDELARLPTQADFSSLNVSNAAAVALYIAHARRIASP